MKQRFKAFLGGGASQFGAAKDGSVVVEFALISTVLMALFAAAVDLSFMVGAKRDAERMSTLLVRAMSSCPTVKNAVPATWKGTTCVKETLEMVNFRRANVIVAIPSFTLQSAAVLRVNDEIKMCSGVSTNMPSFVNSNIKTVLKDNEESGMFAVIEPVYTPFLPTILANFGGTGNVIYSQPSIDLWGKGPDFACAK